MSRDRSTAGGGVLILLGFLAGAFFGIRSGQASLGVLIGVGVGALLAIVVWLLSRRSEDRPPNP